MPNMNSIVERVAFALWKAEHPGVTPVYVGNFEAWHDRAAIAVVGVSCDNDEFVRLMLRELMNLCGQEEWDFDDIVRNAQQERRKKSSELANAPIPF